MGRFPDPRSVYCLLSTYREPGPGWARLYPDLITGLATTL